MIKPGIEKDGNKSVLIGVFNSGYVIALLLFLAAFVCACSDPISRLFGANAGGGTLQPTMEYLFSLAIGAPAHLLTLYMIPLFQLDEKKKLIDITTVIITVVNVSLNILFVVENMGIKGIGYYFDR